jgi:phosphoenolpyruvate---glycerone phosphotransferase subunit DhaL
VPEGWTIAELREGIRRVAAGMESSAGELNALDGALGDGDLGVTMQRGMRGLADKADTLPPDVGAALLACAQVFTRVSGSTFGTLLATGMMSLARKTKGREEIPWAETSSLLGEATADMARRGKSAPGDKTVLDVLEAVGAAVRDLADPAAIAAAAPKAAHDALDRFRGQPSRQGRARIFADRSVGLDDPGMVALARVVEALCG